MDLDQETSLPSLTYVMLRLVRCLKSERGDVRVRYSLDDCKTMTEVPVRAAPAVDDQTDRYVACIPLPTMTAATLTMAVRLTVNESTFWDNNDGANYSTPVGSSLKKIAVSRSIAEKTSFSSIDARV